MPVIKSQRSVLLDPNCGLLDEEQGCRRGALAPRLLELSYCVDTEVITTVIVAS